MSDSAISQLTRAPKVAGNDLLYVSAKTGNTYTSKSVTANAMFANVASNLAVHGETKLHANVTITGNKVVSTANVSVQANFTAKSVVVANTKITFGGKMTAANGSVILPQYSFFFDDDYLYVSVANNHIKRVALEDF